jgi:exopolyphosphatase/guanosine-5'-triphosphate,3'-diphosphate pyrophosphatase
MIIAIDLGSNTIRVSKVDEKTQNRVKEYQKVVQTAKNISLNGGYIENSTIKRVIKAIDESKEIIEYSKNDKIIAVTTQALRVAKNQKDVLKKIYKKTGIKFRVISEEEEAYLTFLAIESRAKKLKIKNPILSSIDLGGASTEIVFDKNYSKSFSIGLVTLYDRYKSLKKIKQNIKKELKPIKLYIKNKKVKKFSLISTAGTATTLAALKHNLNYNNYNYKLINGSKIKLHDFKVYSKILKSMGKKERDKLIGKNRYKLLMTGFITLKGILKLFKKKSSIVVDDGLREGIVIEYMNKK